MSNGVESNGSYVSRAELRAHLDPIRDDISEIKEDVKSLLYAAATQKGVEMIQGKLTAKKRLVSDRRLAWGGIGMGTIGGLWWVQDAIAKLTHHG